jgi:hypothetical protein
MRPNLLCCAITLILGAGCRQDAGAGSAAPGASGTGKSELGAHTLLTHDQGKGTAPATTAPVDTQASGSTLLAVSMGRNANFVTPTDNYHNAWTMLGHRNSYAGGPFYTAVWTAVAAKGGAGHTLSAAKPSDPVDEISLALIEIRNGSVIRDARYAYPQSGSRMSAGTVRTDGAATLVAIWSGDGSQLQHSAVPSDGFQVIESYLMLGPSSGVQIAVGVKQVAAAGQYTMSWNAAPEQGAACYLIAVQ